MNKLKRPSRRIVIVGIASLLILLAAGTYAWQSLAAWKSYETRLLSEQKEYTRLKGTALNGKTTGERLAAIRGLDDKLDSRRDLCKMNGIFAWQSNVVPVLKSGVKQCEDKLKQLNVIAGPLGELRDYLDSAEQLQQIVTTLAPGEAFTENNWAEKGLKQAKGVQSRLKALKGEGDAKELNTKAVSLSNSLVGAWEGLVKANEAKDKTAFLSSSTAVLKAYADFTGLADTADAAIKDKVDAVTEAAAEL